jgi:hypothetical protein
MTDTGNRIDAAIAWAQIEAQHAERNRLADEVRPRNKAAILAALAAAGIAYVIVTFDGSGDSGQIEDVSAFADGVIVDMPVTEAEISTPSWDGSGFESRNLRLHDAIEQLEINEGAYGEFSFDVAGNAIRLDYNERVETTEFSGHEW